MPDSPLISREHAVAQAILADYPAAWLVWATVIGNRRLMLDYAYPPAGAPIFSDFGEGASAVVEASWSPDDAGPWQRYEEHGSTWRVEIAAT